MRGAETPEKCDLNKVLRLGVLFKKAGTAKWALDSGADPMLRLPGGDGTLLHYAAQTGDHETCLVLLAAGADPLAPERGGNRPPGATPLDFAIKRGGRTAMALITAAPPESLCSGHLLCCPGPQAAASLAGRMPLSALAEAALSGSGRWATLAIEALARREASELRKAAKKPKAAKARGRL